MYEDTRKFSCIKDETHMDRLEFREKAPRFSFDRSHYDSKIKEKISDIKVEIEFLKAPPVNPTCYLLLIYENLLNNPFNEVVTHEL